MVRGRLLALQEELAEVARRSGRATADITILGVTKHQPRAMLIAAIEAGLRDVGENYLQEAKEKFNALPPVRKHFLGHLQTNKARGIAECFDMVQSVDRIEAGRALARAARTLGKRLPVLIQLNISPAERFGVAPERARALADELRSEGLDVDGVMAIGPQTSDPQLLNASFERAAKAFAEVGGSTLSLGMSGDWREAVAHGSTMIRLGTALFGERTPPQRERATA